MRKHLSFLIILFFIEVPGVGAGEVDKDFMLALLKVKNPFVVDLPKTAVIQRPQAVVSLPKPDLVVKPTTMSARQKPEVKFPDLKLQGIIMGGDIHQAIINDRIIGQQEKIQGALVTGITQDGVELLFKGEKRFLKTESQH